MPPKPKFTKEEIVAAALALVSEKGMETLTARELGLRLGSSARPIFTVFQSMEEVQRQVRKAAMEHFNSFTEKAMNYTPAFKQFGMQMVLFAKEEPRLFRLLFMTENAQARSFEDVFAELGGTARLCIGLIERDYGLTEPEAMELFRHVWIHTYGIGALCATGMCGFTEEEINGMMGHDFAAMMLLIKSGKLKEKTVTPVERGQTENYLSK